MGIAVGIEHGVTEDGGVGPGRDIGGQGVLCIGELVVVVGEGGGQVSAGAEAEDGDGARVDVPVGGVPADKPDSALGIVDRVGMPAGVDAVSENGGVEALLVEGVGDRLGFMTGQVVVASAGQNEDDRAGRVGRGAGRGGGT